MKLLGPMDAAWLYLESRDTPMHFATVMTFSPPDDAPAMTAGRLSGWDGNLLIAASP